MNTLEHYMTRTTLPSGSSTLKIVIMASSTAMFEAATAVPSGAKFEFKLLGVGLPTVRVGRRLFHTLAQADSYGAGYYYRSMTATKPALDDFRDLGNADADSDNEYREAAMHDYDSNCESDF